MASESSARPRDRAATEAEIVAAAERILMSHGWAQLNVQTLAAEAGVDRKLVYRYFDGVDGVVTRLATQLNDRLAATLAAEPPSTATRFGPFARETLTGWLRALRAHPLAAALMAWELAEDRPVLRATEAGRAAVLQAWARDRRPRLKAPPAGDVVALNAVLMAGVQHLALTASARDGFAGVAFDPAGWARIEAALNALTAVWPDHLTD